MNIQDISFISNNLKLHGLFNCPKNSDIGILFLHGGGKSSSERYRFLIDEFNSHNISCLAFDFGGCGKSEGVFEGGSLSKREIDAQNALEYFIKQTYLELDSIYLWSSSMGGHIACKLLNKNKVRGVVLQSAAAYGQDSESARFNLEFTNLIKKPNNWNDSLVFEYLHKFNGKKILIYGENDEVIPSEVKNLYQKCLSKDDAYILLKNASHRILSPQNEIENKALKHLALILPKYLV